MEISIMNSCQEKNPAKYRFLQALFYVSGVYTINLK